MGMKDLITEIVQALVDQPDHVLVTEIEQKGANSSGYENSILHEFTSA
jgi:predicted RNA-binding protein YlqC (UPF0109 family)